jgi:hypothetical protein
MTPMIFHLTLDYTFRETANQSLPGSDFAYGAASH